ncbi:MAG TPA: hypothetical protein VK646_02275 [Actinomycetota bacterium]|nr:hypothetical protein [Actinomycetota bacterium]
MLEVEIETHGGDGLEYPDEAIGDFLDTLAELGARGAAVSAGGKHHALGATFGVDLDEPDPMDPGGSFAEAARFGVELFQTACGKVGIRHGGIGSVQVFTGEMLERSVNEEPETYLGVTELAKELHVSRQRIAELRRRPDFPAPLVELAAGPVWCLSTLRRFVETWDRKPGRPRKTEAS